jgi:HD-GYP domain-containing protein (c-di-GMP phosphodiesterase class II)
VIGALIVGAIPGMEEVVPGVRNHHERYDGLGYPDGLAGDDIPLLARILAVADVYSAMTTHRPYRKALTRAAALRQIERDLGSHFDPEIGRAFISIQQAQTAPASLFDEPPPLQAPARRDPVSQAL